MNPTLAALQWYLDAGVDEVIAEIPWNRRLPSAEAPGTGPVSSTETVPKGGTAPNPSLLARQPSAMTQDSEAASGSATAPTMPGPAPRGGTGLAELEDELAGIDNLESLRERLESYEDCALKATAMNTVFGTGPADADLMVIGEAPGEEEDRKGEPFVGPSGRLLDRMLSAIGLDRGQVYITNTLYWRPPGNRTPTAQEIQACAPFLRRQLALVAPKVLMMVGGAAAKTLLQRSEGIMRLRGRWHTLEVPGLDRPVHAIATYHPAYLLRSPGQKREAWQDLQAVRDRLREQ